MHHHRLRTPSSWKVCLLWNKFLCKVIFKRKQKLKVVNVRFVSAAKQLSERSVGEKKPRLPGEKVPFVTELYGYNLKRQEFEIEHDNDAEQLLSDMEFKDCDTDAEREQKLQVLHIYSKRYIL